MSSWEQLNRRIVACKACPRLRAHCDLVAREKRRAFRDWEYWGKPVPNFGDPQAQLLVVGLAPAAHGANRTGRMFTGDRSGQWLYRALHKAGFASQAESNSASDGLTLRDCAITAVCHCAPPANRPTREEINNCHVWLRETVDQLPVRLLLALGQIAWSAIMAEVTGRRWCSGTKAKFAHGAELPLDGGRWLLGSYHPSQQNTFTGRLTPVMFDGIFQRARRILSANDD